MTNIYQFQTDNQIYEDASLWVTRLDRGLSDEETEALRQWLSLSPKHKTCLLEMATLWDRMDSLSVLSELFDPPAAQPRATAPDGKRNLGRAVWAVAASALVLVLGFNLLVPATFMQELTSRQPLQANTSTSNTLYETGIGAHSTINLPDGTKLLLNTNTQVSVTYSDHERLLVLNKGELLVEVAHDKQRPLRVQVGDRVVEAVGTVFNVYLKDELDFDVIVTEGKVHVKPMADKTNTIANATSEPGVIQVLGQGEKLSARASEPVAVETINTAVIHDRLSWRDGNLVFRGETLQDALNELSRYTPESFKVVDQRISHVRIAGLYKAGDVDGLLVALKENFNIDSSRSSEGVIELSLLQ
ncbi:FecR family protein [Cellvibrio mixtus]|uniref:FecR family protein n=1 Tax=Cellvibrio mixtus TaxID=39650 RepID=UPI0005879C63|nr:FecR domain-containing protein [Cellvibrio mixtus]